VAVVEAITDTDIPDSAVFPAGISAVMQSSLGSTQIKKTPQKK